MLGYLRVSIPELKVKHFEFYKSLYCGLCIGTKKQFPNFFRLFINHDIIFLYLLFISTLNNLNYHVKRQSCIFHPLSKRNIFYEDKYFQIFVEISFILSYMKIYDQFIDEGGLFRKINYYIFKSNLKKVKIIRDYFPDIEKVIEDYFNSEFTNKFDNIYQFLDQFINIVLKLIPFDFLEARNSDILKIIFKNILYIVFILDAIEDFEEDIKNNRKNLLMIYLKSINSQSNIKIDKKFVIKQSIKFINFSTETYKNAFEKLKEINLNRINNLEILENYLFIGLPEKVKEVLYEKNKKTCRRVL